MASLNRVKFQNGPSSNGHAAKNRSNTDFNPSGLSLNTIEVQTSLTSAPLSQKVAMFESHSSNNSTANISTNNSASKPHRIRSQTGGVQRMHISNHSPRHSARPHSTKHGKDPRNRSTTERKSVQNMWVHSTSTSVFSMHGMEAMLAKLDRFGSSKYGAHETDSATNSPISGGGGGGGGSQSLPASRHNSVIHRAQISADSPSANAMSPPFRGSSPPHMRSRKSSEHSNKRGTVGSGGGGAGMMPHGMALVMNPTSSMEEQTDWEDRIKKWETEGDWIECRETLTGRVMWYNTMSNRLIFDTPPDGVTQLPGSQYTLSSH